MCVCVLMCEILIVIMCINEMCVCNINIIIIIIV